MVFYDITENSLNWNWEISENEGDTWQLRPARLQTRLFYQQIIGLEKEIRTLLPMHGPSGTLEDLERSIYLMRIFEAIEI